jgi:hypothetical protein
MLTEHQTVRTKKETPPRHIIIKTLSTQNKERILKATKKKSQVTYKGNLIRITAGFNSKCRKVKERHNSGLERKQLST